MKPLLIIVACLSFAGCATNQVFADLDLNNPNSKASIEVRENAHTQVAAENAWKADWCIKAKMDIGCLN